MNDPMRLESLTVRYGRQLACRDVSLAVPQGAVYALLGRNGAGKSSLVRCLLGQQRASSGRTLLFGGDAWKTRRRAMERTGVVPEEPDAPPAMTARQLSDFCRRAYPRWDARAVLDRLSRFAVPEGTPFGRLSKGQKGEVMLALALGHSPELLVLDDPTLGLDVVARRALCEEIVGELADRGTTVFLTTHDLAAFEGIATRVGILKEGRLALDEDLEVLRSRFRRIRYTNHLTETRTAFGTELDEFHAERVQVRGWGIDAIVSNFDEAALERLRATDGVENVQAEAMPLEEIFLAVAGEDKTAEGAAA
ncbi:MAG TPA: ABC transporter ATP-binding protein [Thermoanaerobaculia bacterium]|nr:ABC transporter ATP-binding protein [Thermoanaerobaculia bacterium]